MCMTFPRSSGMIFRGEITTPSIILRLSSFGTASLGLGPFIVAARAVLRIDAVVRLSVVDDVARQEREPASRVSLSESLQVGAVRRARRERVLVPHALDAERDQILIVR